MAAGDRRPVDFNNISDLDLPYTAERRQIEPYSNQRFGEQTQEMKAQQAKALINPFLQLPICSDYGYPNSVLNVVVNEHNFRLPNYFHKKVKNYEMGRLLTEAPFTRLVMSYDFRIIESYLQEQERFRADFTDDNQPDASEKSATEAESSTDPTDTDDVAAKLDEMVLGNPRGEPEPGPPEPELRDRTLISGPDLQIFDDNLIYTIEGGYGRKVHFTYTVFVPYELAPFSIATGNDTEIDPPSNLMPQFVIVDTVNAKEMIEQVAKYIDVQSLPNDLRDCLVYDMIIYFWSRSKINYGHSYWIMIDGETVYLYHLSSSFRLPPLVWNEDGIIADMNTASFVRLQESFGLTYFHTFVLHYLDYVGKKEYATLMILAEKCLNFMNSSLYPAEYALMNVVTSEHTFPYTINIDEPEIGKPEQVFKNVFKDKEAYGEFENVHFKSLSFLLMACETLISGASVSEDVSFPYRKEVASPNTPKEQFTLNYLLQQLDPGNVQRFNEREYRRLFEDFTGNQNLILRVAARTLKKMFFDEVVWARVCHSWELYAQCVHHCEAALSAWIALCSFIKPEKLFPLPLRPLYMIGDSLYNAARTEFKRGEFLKEYRPSYRNGTIKVLERVSSVIDNRCIRSIHGDDTSMQLMEKGLSFLARAVLYTDMETELPFLVRLCVVANDIAFTHLENCLGKKKPYPSFPEAKDYLVECKRVLDMVLRMSEPIRGANSQVHITSLLIKAKYFQTHSTIYAGHFKKVHDKYFEFYAKARDVFDEAYIAARKIVKEKVELGTEVVRNEDLDLILAIIWRYREYEDQKSISYHSKIIPLFEAFLKKCQDGFEFNDPHYFRYKYGLGCAALAEYLFGMYKDSKNILVRDMTEYWFLEARNGLQGKDSYYKLELIKITCDLIAFYENVASNEPNVSNEYDKKAMETLMKCYELLKLYSQFDWREMGNKEKDEKIKRTFLMLRHIERRLQTIVLKRRSSTTTIDISPTDAHQFFVRTLSRANHLYDNLTSILEDIKRILNV